jgi:hypothetical protein
MLAKSRLWWGADEGLAAYLVLLLCNFVSAMLQFSVLLLAGIMGCSVSFSVGSTVTVLVILQNA